jgi:predicted RNA-binding Zn ribbon-like protein
MAQRQSRGAVPSEDADSACCLAFVNTLSGRASPAPVDTLVSFDAFVAWACRQTLLTADEAERLLSRSKRRHREAEQIVAQARSLREQLHDTLTAMAAGQVPPLATLDGLSESLGEWYRFARLVPSGESLQWTYAGADGLAHPLWEVARAAARLLTSPGLARVRACASVECGWWFLDETKNGSRRWCDMKSCGNREKLRRFRRVHS